jgi:lipoprotein-anchoring transpeptidase ErfK/SrfK
VVTRISTWKIVKTSLKVFGLVVAGVIACLVLALFGYDLYYRSTVFKGVNVAGIYVGGMSRDDAVEELRHELDLEALNSNIVLTFDDKTWDLPLYRIGAYVDLNESVDQALSQAGQIPFYERWLKRYTFQGMDQEIDLVVEYDPVALESFIEEMRASIDCEPVSAEISLQSNKLVFTSSRDGWKLNTDEARRLILETLSNPERTAQLNIAVTPPDVSDDQMGKVIAVDLTRHQLTLYSNMVVEVQYSIACGAPGYPTPKGTYKIVSKEANPTWRNPGSAWAASMPPSIPPGPGNPLGTRALGTSNPGVFIHGTSNSGSIGTSASHGCIRMLIRDSEDLFPRVEVGTPVLFY